MKRTTLLLILTLFAFRAEGQENPHKDFVEELDEYIPKRLNRKRITGVSVSIMIDNQVVLSSGYGYADRENEIPVDVNTPFAIGSVSKIVAATAVLKLHSDGKINIDQPYTRYVPDFQMKAHHDQRDELTPRHLLAHYGGIPRVHAKGFLLKKSLPLDRILEFSNEEYMIAPPGKVYQYSDWGTDLLALLVQRVSGKSYEDYVQEEIFNPLGMANSGFGPTSKNKGYVKNKPVATYEYSFPGSDGVLSTSEDLLKLGQLYLKLGMNGTGKRMLSKEITAESMERQFQDASLAMDKSIGLMWDVINFRGTKLIRKGGIHEPYFSQLTVIPEYNAVVAVTSNSNSSSEVHWTVLWETIMHLRELYGLKRPSKLRGNPHTKVKLTDQEFEKVEGNYSTDIGIMNFKRSGNKFKVRLLKGNDKGTGVPYSNGMIKLRGRLLGLIPVPFMDIYWKEVGDETIVGQQYRSGLRTVGGSKIKEGPIPESWKQAVGTYRVSNYEEHDYRTFEEVRIKINDVGVLEMRGNVSFPSKFNFHLALSPLSDELAVVPGYSFNFFGGETIRKEIVNGKPVIYFSGYRLEKK